MGKEGFVKKGVNRRSYNVIETKKRLQWGNRERITNLLDSSQELADETHESKETIRGRFWWQDLTPEFIGRQGNYRGKPTVYVYSLIYKGFWLEG